MLLSPRIDSFEVICFVVSFPFGRFGPGTSALGSSPCPHRRRPAASHGRDWRRRMCCRTGWWGSTKGRLSGRIPRLKGRLDLDACDSVCKFPGIQPFAKRFDHRLCPGVHLMLELNDKTDAAPYAASELAVRRWSREVTPHIVALVNAMPVGPAFAAVDLSMLRAHSNA